MVAILVKGDGMMMKAEELLEEIKNMENAERWKLLDKMYDMFYNASSTNQVKEESPEEKSLESESGLDLEFVLDKISKLEREIFYLKKK